MVIFTLKHRQFPNMKNAGQNLFLLIICFLALSVAVSGQTENEPVTRSINSLDFQMQRPAQRPTESNINKKGAGEGAVKAKTPAVNKKRRKNIAVVTNPGRRYTWVKRNAAFKTKTTASGKANPKGKKFPLKNEELGVTFWRLRPLKSSERDDAPTFAVNTGDGTENWTAERVSSTTKFKISDRVRFTLESPRSGYLYVINREFYADETTGAANLIYPTLKSRSKGDNRVIAGSLIEIPPSQSGSYFNVKSTNPGYAGEEIIVIISPLKIPGVAPGAQEVALNREKVEKWMNDWGATIDTYDATDGEGIAYTRTEAEAAGTRALTQEEPLPQTIYRVKTRADKPLVVTFRMQAKTP